MDRLIQMGKDLGYVGEKLQDFVKRRKIRKGNLKGIGSRRRKKKGRITSPRRKKKGRITSPRRKKKGQISSRRKKKKGKSS